MNNSFKIERITWHQVSDKIIVDPIHEALNAHIDLSKYGSGIQFISFTYIAVQPEDKLHPNFAEYDKQTKQIHIGLGLSYEHVENAKSKKMLEILARLFVVSIDLYNKFNITDFNITSFKKDVDLLFGTNGWLKVVQNR